MFLVYVLENNTGIFQNIRFIMIIPDILASFVSLEWFFGSKESESFLGICLFVSLTGPSSDTETQFLETGRVWRVFTGQSKLGNHRKFGEGVKPMRNDVNIRISWKTFILKKLFSILFMIMGMMFYASSGVGEVLVGTHDWVKMIFILLM
jgi:hypothetical protein